jgi:hypothetical protein
LLKILTRFVLVVVRRKKTWGGIFMTKVLMLSTGDEAIDRYNRVYFNRLSASALADKFKQHTLTDSPDLADIILFVGHTFLDQRDVRSHPYVKKYPQKCFLLDPYDYTIPFLPGVYVGITKRWYDPKRVAPGAYVHIMAYTYVPYVPSLDGCQYLFSFVGSARSHHVRSKVLSLKHPHAYLQDTSITASDKEEKRRFFTPNYTDDMRQHYGRVLSASKFVLAPRGYGPSSWRILEAMRAGRVPVIISDQWVPSKGIDWNSFSIRIPETEVMKIPQILDHHEAKAALMGEAAHEAYESWFSVQACFHRTIEWCLELKRQNRIPLTAYLQLLRPHFLRYALMPRIPLLKTLRDRVWPVN